MIMSDSLKRPSRTRILFAQQQVRALVERDPDFYPLYTDQREVASLETSMDALV